MKKFIYLFLSVCLFITSIPYTFTAKANETNYLRVINEETALYSDKELTNLIFYLPYTYYVKIIEDFDDVVHVEYGGGTLPKIDGFVLKEQLYNDGLSVENPYPEISLKTLSSTAFYKDASCTDILQYVFADRNLGYYGKISTPSDGIIYFVCYNGKLGYVKEECITPFTLDNHPNELSFLTEEQILPDQSLETELTEEEKKERYVLRVAVILCIIFAGFIALFTIKRPKHNKADSYYYDENEYR